MDSSARHRTIVLKMYCLFSTIVFSCLYKNRLTNQILYFRNGFFGKNAICFKRHHNCLSDIYSGFFK